MKIVLIGAGKLAWHLGPALQQSGAEILQVYSRTLAHAEKLGARMSVKACNQIHQLVPEADLYILAVADQAIQSVAQQINSECGIQQNLVHTSGATPESVFQGLAVSFGVFYPLQSFSKEVEVDFTKVPFCLSANRPELGSKLHSLASRLSPLVYQLNDDQRAQLHLSAVFANNFVNHLIGISHALLEEASIPRAILQNIIRSTVIQLESGDAKALQTGPAIRKDTDTLKRHEAQLATQPEILELYQKLSKHIIKVADKQ